MTRLKSYSEYKNSCVPGVGTIPNHWQGRKLRQLLKRTTERNRPSLPLLSVVREKGVILRDRSASDENHNFIPEDLTNYKVVRRGQFVMNKMKAWQGSYGVSPFDGIVSPAYFVFNLVGVEGRFFHSAIRSRAYVPSFAGASDGVRIGQWDLSEGRMREIGVALPPPDEQAAIVRFLAHVDRRIRRYIAAKLKLIKLLEEKKELILEDGVGWRKYSVAPLMRFIQEISDYRGATPEKVEAGAVLVTAKNIRMGWIDYSASREYVRQDQYDRIMRRGKPQIGDIILTMEAPLGNVALADREDIAFAQRVIRLRCDSSRLLPGFALHAMMSVSFQEQLRVRATGSTAQGLKASKLPQLTVPIPPLDVQAQIAGRLHRKLKTLGELELNNRTDVAILSEYRTSLIANVVTGKLDVRDVAARLPEEAEDDTADVVAEGVTDSAAEEGLVPAEAEA